MNEFSRIKFRRWSLSVFLPSGCDKRVSEVESLFRFSIEQKKKKTQIALRLKSDEKTQKLRFSRWNKKSARASIQYREKLAQFLFNIAREFSRFSNKFLDSARDHPQIMSREKNFLVPMKKWEICRLWSPSLFCELKDLFKWNLRSDNQIFIFLPFLGLVLLRCELSFVAFSEFLRKNDRISKHSQNRQPKKKNIWKFVGMIVNFFAGFCYQFLFFAFLETLN